MDAVPLLACTGVVAAEKRSNGYESSICTFYAKSVAVPAARPEFIRSQNQNYLWNADQLQCQTSLESRASAMAFLKIAY
jgi:hypothetical protein